MRLLDIICHGGVNDGRYGSWNGFIKLYIHLRPVIKQENCAQNHGLRGQSEWQSS